MNWAHYLLQVNIYLIVFYVFYRLLLEKETYFVLNRIYLISSGVLSMVIPFLRFEWFAAQPVSKSIYIGIDQAAMIMERVAYQAPERYSWSSLLVTIYAGGVIFFLIRLAVQMLIVSRFLKSNLKGSAFSFFKIKLVDANLPDQQTIHAHENIHIRQWHTLDVIFFELLGALIWFNPIIYFYKTTIKNIHEFLADEEAASFKGDKKEYALLLLSNAFGLAPTSIINRFFNKSLIKKRIFMLQKQRSRKAAILKYGLVVPIFALALILSSASIRKNDNLQALTKDVSLNEPLAAVNDIITVSTEDLGLTKPSIAQPPTAMKKDDEWSNFYKFMSRNIRYPLDALKANIQGNSQVTFAIEGGQIEELRTTMKLGGGIAAEVMRSVLAYGSFNQIKDGKYALTVAFNLNGSPASIKFLNQDIRTVPGYIPLNKLVVVGFAQGSEQASGSADKVFDYVSLDERPSFPGGMREFYSFLQKNIKYPREAAKDNIQGKVYVSFTVEANGTLSNFKVDRGVGAGLDEEAVRVLNLSPKWKPGKMDGEAVRVKYNIPISFNLNKEDSNKVGSVIKVRPGSSTPKPSYYIDGIKASEEDLEKMDTKSIKSISVLKDGQAMALYGEDAKNGVIVVELNAGAKNKDSNKEITVQGYGSKKKDR